MHVALLKEKCVWCRYPFMGSDIVRRRRRRRGKEKRFTLCAACLPSTNRTEQLCVCACVYDLFSSLLEIVLLLLEY